MLMEFWNEEIKELKVININEESLQKIINRCKSILQNINNLNADDNNLDLDQDEIDYIQENFNNEMTFENIFKLMAWLYPIPYNCSAEGLEDF